MTTSTRPTREEAMEMVALAQAHDPDAVHWLLDQCSRMCTFLLPKSPVNTLDQDHIDELRAEMIAEVWASLDTWDPDRGAWSTFLGLIWRRCSSRIWRRYKKHHEGCKQLAGGGSFSPGMRVHLTSGLC